MQEEKVVVNSLFPSKKAKKRKKKEKRKIDMCQHMLQTSLPSNGFYPNKTNEKKSI